VVFFTGAGLRQHLGEQADRLAGRAAHALGGGGSGLGRHADFEDYPLSRPGRSAGRAGDSGGVGALEAAHTARFDGAAATPVTDPLLDDAPPPEPVLVDARETSSPSDAATTAGTSAGERGDGQEPPEPPGFDGPSPGGGSPPHSPSGPCGGGGAAQAGEAAETAAIV